MTNMGQSDGKKLFDIGWLIGIIDGEGCYILSKQYHYKSKTLYFFPSIEIANDNEVVISNCIRIIKEQFKVGPHVRTVPRKTGKLGYKVSLQGVKRLCKALPTLVDYEISKKEQAKLLLEYVNNRLIVNRGTPVSNRDVEIAIAIRKLNNSHDNIDINIPRKLNNLSPNDYTSNLHNVEDDIV